MWTICFSMWRGRSTFPLTTKTIFSLFLSRTRRQRRGEAAYLSHRHLCRPAGLLCLFQVSSTITNLLHKICTNSFLPQACGFDADKHPCWKLAHFSTGFLAEKSESNHFVAPIVYRASCSISESTGEENRNYKVIDGSHRDAGDPTMFCLCSL